MHGFTEREKIQEKVLQFIPYYNSTTNVKYLRTYGPLQIIMKYEKKNSQLPQIQKILLTLLYTVSHLRMEVSVFDD